MRQTWKRERSNNGWRISFWALFLATAVAGSAWGASQYEVPQDRRAQEVLPAHLICGPHYQVQDRVAADGYMYRFTVNSDYGTFTVTGEYGLRKLLKEIQAIAVLQQVNKREAVMAGARGKARETREFAANLLDDPVNTVASVPQGVARLLGNIAAGLQDPHDPRRDTMAQKVLNVSDAKRKLAYNLGVDVYSSNRVLQDELDNVARAEALGALAVSAAIPYGGGAAVGLSRMSRTAADVSQLLRDTAPGSLRDLNLQKLQALGVERGLAARFLDHYAFTPRHQTIIVACLEKLRGARGKDAFLRLALAAHDEETANFFQNTAEMLRGYHETVAPLQEIRTPGVLVGRAVNNAAFVPFPLDYGVWSTRAEQVVKKSLAAQPGRPKPDRIELWVSGAMSPLARRQLQALGVQVVENVSRRSGMMD